MTWLPIAVWLRPWRAVRTNLHESDVKDRGALAQSLFDHIPVGVGSQAGPATHLSLRHRMSFNMTKCVKPLGHLVRLSAKSSRSTNQNAPFRRLVLLVAKCLSGFTHFVTQQTMFWNALHDVAGHVCAP
jgi:hypothetical protein